MLMMIVVKPGTKDYPAGNTNKMPQHIAKQYLENIIGAGSRVTNLSQALNQAFDGNGKATGDYRFQGQPVLHASAGKPGVSSVTLFYYVSSDVLYLFAMGQHESSSSYKITDFGPNTGDFRLGKTIPL